MHLRMHSKRLCNPLLLTARTRAAGDLVQGLGVEGFRGLGLEAEMMTNTIL